MEITVGLAKDFITPITVDPGRKLVLLTAEEALVLLPNGSWTRTPLKGLKDIASKAQPMSYEEARLKLAKAQRDLAAAGLKYELDCVTPPYRWHRKGGEGC
jgi:hypothetical protein